MSILWSWIGKSQWKSSITALWSVLANHVAFSSKQLLPQRSPLDYRAWTWCAACPSASRAWLWAWLDNWQQSWSCEAIVQSLHCSSCEGDRLDKFSSPCSLRIRQATMFIKGSWLLEGYWIEKLFTIYWCCCTERYFAANGIQTFFVVINWYFNFVNQFTQDT